MWLTALPVAVTLVLTQVPVEAARARRPKDARALLRTKHGTIQPSLAADLARFDWLLVGHWSDPEQQWSRGYADDQLFQHDFVRVRADGAELRFSFVVDHFDPRKGTVNHLTSTSLRRPSPPW